ncbi:hypothetical protein D9Y22_17445 [Methylorubrum sp. DB1722]|nr:hypothetical protein [Methylorubrum sp. DB1722]
MSGRLSPTMLAVLQGIATPHPDDDPFPPVRTLAALERRKLIRFVEIRKPRGTLEALVGRHLQRIEITAAGRAALIPTPTPGGLAEGERS